MPSFSTAERISLTASLTFWVTPSSCGCAFFRYSTFTPSFEVALLPLCKVFLPTLLGDKRPSGATDSSGLVGPCASPEALARLALRRVACRRDSQLHAGAGGGRFATARPEANAVPKTS